MTMQSQRTKAVAETLNIGNDDLEDIGNYLRTLAMKSDKSYRDTDGIVLKMS